MGAASSALIDGLRIMHASDQRNRFVTDPTRDSHPSLAERARFGKEVAKRLAAGANR
jgi:hypothetical protein